MGVGLILKPGQSGTKRLMAQYGERLICVRYRYDRARQRRLKTVELVVEERPWRPPPARAALKPATVVGVRVGASEVELQRRVKRAGGRWNRERRLWELRYDRAQALGLAGRVVRPSISR